MSVTATMLLVVASFAAGWLARGFRARRQSQALIPGVTYTLPDGGQARIKEIGISDTYYEVDGRSFWAPHAELRAAVHRAQRQEDEKGSSEGAGRLSLWRPERRRRSP